jgi:hypothetical protein
MADSGFPNYLRVGPDGSVNADFSGHVAASGVDLPAYEGATIPLPPPGLPNSKVSWKRQSDGSLVADLFGTYDATNNRRGLWLEVGSAPASYSQRKLILDDGERSSFVQTSHSAPGMTKLYHVVGNGGAAIGLAPGATFLDAVVITEIGASTVFVHTAIWDFSGGGGAEGVSTSFRWAGGGSFTGVFRNNAPYNASFVPFYTVIEFQ